MNSKLPISVTMLVKNSAKYLEQVLQALNTFDEVLLLDNGSTDNTLEIAKQFENVVIKHSPFIGFGDLKNLAAKYAKHDWILNIDSDEVFPKALIKELSKIDLNNPNKVYAMLRLNHYRGKVIKTCGWYPDYVRRLYNRTKVNFNHKQVHESLELSSDIETVRLKNHFLHYSFDGAAALIQKMQQYTTLFAEQNKFKKRTSILGAVAHGLSSFVKHYFLKKGILDGRDGFVISTANAMGSYYKYIKLAEDNDKLTVSLIITTYNRPDALSAVLQSVLVQTELPQQVIVADDGSTQETAEIIKQFQTNFPVPLLHCWQPDNGFKLAESRNRALAQATSDYIVVIDGDMVMHPKFIADHKKAAKRQVFIQGGRVVLPEEKTTEILRNPLRYQQIKWYQKGIEKRLEKRFSTCHFPILNQLLHKEKSDYYKGIRGCNMGFFREDALVINGFNNDFIGWGREDSEFVARLFNSGVKRRDIRFAAIAYHLYHYEAKRDALPENDQRLKMAIEQKLIRCDNGIEQLKKFDE